MLASPKPTIKAILHMAILGSPALTLPESATTEAVLHTAIPCSPDCPALALPEPPPQRPYSTRPTSAALPGHALLNNLYSYFHLLMDEVYLSNNYRAFE